MNISYRVNDSLTIAAEADTQADAFAVVSSLHEVFAVSECGCCGGPVHPRTRVVDDCRFFEMACGAPGCGAVLAYGANKKGGSLYPRRRWHSEHSEVKAGRAKEGDWIPNGGWVKYVPTAK